MNFSIIVPHFNEEKNLLVLTKSIIDALQNFSYEIIFVNDGGNDNSRDQYCLIKNLSTNVTFLEHSINCGQSAAINSGILNSNYENILLIDADNQNNPLDFLKLIKIFQDGNIDFVSGQRQERKDSYSKKIASKIANSTRSFVLRDGCKDTGCSLKLFKKEKYLRIPFFDNNHRFLPALFLREGCSIKFVDVSHNKRLYGISKYNNLNRLIVGLIDLFGVYWLIKRKKYNKVSKYNV